MAGAALAVSIFALLVSALAALAYWRQVKWAKVAASAQAQLAAIEEARHTTDVVERERATLSVHFEPVGTNSHMLVVRNEGPATASHVTIDLAPRIEGDVAPEMRDSSFPATIAPDAEATAFLSESLTTTTQLIGTIKWTDDEGGHEDSRELTIR
jgi:hypothetical protein